jgi:lambda family phage portal protein
MFDWFRKAPPKKRRAPAKPRVRKTQRIPDNGQVIARMYATAKQSRLTAGWGTIDSSADTELVSSLPQLRSRSRAVVRDAPYAKRAKVIVQNNVIGAGIGLQAKVRTARDEIKRPTNDAIEEAWKDWARGENCHTGGELDFEDMERQAVGQIFEAGEVFFRKHYVPFGNSTVPYALELIEPERVADEFQFSNISAEIASGNTLRMGVEVDRYYRPVAYFFRRRHPGELRFQVGIDKIERVPAEQIIHLRLIDRWPQTRGEPWLHATLRRLNDMDGYSEAEIVAARAAACYMGVIQQPEGDNALAAKTQSDGSLVMQLESGVILRLNPGEEFNGYTPSRPNTAMDPFMRLMLREVAAGSGISYESLSRDYSQSNYSSSRLALLDDRDLWRVLQLWFIRRFRQRVHREWLAQAVLSRTISAISLEEYALNPKKFEAVRFKPRGWGWIDPNKEVEAYKSAERAGYITKTQVIAQTGNGMDLEDVLDEREQELELIKEKGLEFDSSPNAAAAPKPDEPASTDNNNGQPAASDSNNPPQRVFPLRRQ